MRINLYLPDDKRELYEFVKESLEKQGQSVSQLFLEALQNYAEKFSKEIELKKRIIEYIADLFTDIYPNVYIVRERIGKKKPDFILEVDKGSTFKIAVVVIKRVPVTKKDVNSNEKLLKTTIFSHEDIVEDYISALVKNKIPLLFIFYTGDDGSIIKIDVIDVLGFRKTEVFPYKRSKEKIINILKEAIFKAIYRNKHFNDEFSFDDDSPDS